MRSGARTRAANRLPSSRSRPPHELGNGQKGQRLSGAGQVSCRAKPSFQRPLRVRLEISLTSTAVRLSEIWAHHQTGHRADLCCEQHHPLACREPNKDFGTHLRRRIAGRERDAIWDGPGSTGSVVVTCPERLVGRYFPGSSIYKRKYQRTATGGHLPRLSPIPIT